MSVRAWPFVKMVPRGLFAFLLTAYCLLPTGIVWADEPATESLKAEIQVLKDRLSRLERQVSEAEFTGISGIGEKAGLPTLNLPSGLQGLAMSGYADVSYIYNFNEADSPTTANTGRVFDTESNGFTPHAFELVFEKAMTDQTPIGFRTDLFAGDDADVIGSTGLADTDAGDSDQVDLQQAYITARAPIGAGIDFKVGKFVTLLGAEVIESPANWNFSRSYMFGYAIPFTHTGALASYPLGEFGSVTGGVVNGWDIVDDTNHAKTLLGNLTLTPLEGVSLFFNAISGAERADNDHDDRTVFDVVGSWQATEQLALMMNYDYGHESSLTQGTGATGFESANWQGLALYAKYDLSPTWALAGRWEWFDDKDNVRTKFTSIGGGVPTDIDFYEWTLTSQWKLHEHVLARLEYRHDKADEKVFVRDEGFSAYQDTVAAEMIYHF